MTIDISLDEEDSLDTDRPDFDFFDNDEPQITDTGSPSTDDTTTTRTIKINDSTHLVLAARDPLLGTGGHLWPAGQVLATYLLKHPHLFTDKSIIELGSGSGLVGLSCAASNPSSSTSTKVILTDLPQILPTLSQNAKLNNIQDCVQVESLKWGEAVPPHLQDCLVVLMSDCIYLESLFEPLLHTLSQVMTRPQAVAYLSYKKRRRADLKFFKLLRKTFYLQELSYVSDPVLSHGIHLYRITNK